MAMTGSEQKVDRRKGCSRGKFAKSSLAQSLVGLSREPTTTNPAGAKETDCNEIELIGKVNGGWPVLLAQSL
jgi:hypothetical protein